LGAGRFGADGLLGTARYWAQRGAMLLRHDAAAARPGVRRQDRNSSVRVWRSPGAVDLWVEVFDETTAGRCGYAKRG
jgi:hypothetical protein